MSKEKIHNMASCMLSILDSLKLYDNDSLLLDGETLSEVMFRKMEAYNIDLNEELGFTHLKPVDSKDIVEVEDVSLYNRYENSKTQGEEEKIEVINEIISTYPKIIDYLYNRLDTCFGEHTVYLVHMKVNGEDMLKVGYTKNDVVRRFGEKRYAGQNTLDIIEVVRDNKLQAKGAVDFEKKLKDMMVGYRTDSNLTLPGKNEFMDIQYKDDIVKMYDTFYEQYKDVEGLKSPN
jgi:hypothetical protein